MDKKFRTGTILAIVSGALGILWGILLFSNLQYAYLRNIVLLGGIFEMVAGIFTVVISYFGLKQKIWGLAIAGSITGLFTFFPTAIAAIVFVSIGKKVFQPLNAAS